MARSEVPRLTDQYWKALPIPYEVKDMDDLLRLIAVLNVRICGGWPCSSGYVVLGQKIEYEPLDQMIEEIIAKTIAQQQAKLDAYRELKLKGLPIPNDLKAEIEGNGLADA